LKKFVEKLDKIENIFLIVMISLQVITVFSFTVARYTQLWRMPWGEEFSRYCMIWMAMIGMIVATKTGGHFAVTAFDSKMPKGVYRFFICLRVLLVDFICVFSAYKGVLVVIDNMGKGQLTPALQWPMWVMYSAVPIGLFFSAIRYTAHNLDNIRGKSSDEEVQL